jgi:hypothetical protein
MVYNTILTGLICTNLVVINPVPIRIKIDGPGVLEVSKNSVVLLYSVCIE